MKILLALFICFIGTQASAGLMNYQEFQQLSATQKVQILKAYKEFISSQNSMELEAKTSSIDWSLISEAYAASNYNCFYAGWPSTKKTVSSNGRQKSICSSPSIVNASYKALAANCKSSELLCNPTLFGSGICVDVSSQSKRNQAFAQCEQKFSVSGKGLSDVVQEISSSHLSSDADELFEVVNSTCATGFQKGTTMCRNLSAKVAKIREAASSKAVAATSEEKVQPKKQNSIIPIAETVVVTNTAESASSLSESVQPTIHPKTEEQVLLDVASQAAEINTVVATSGNANCLPELEVRGTKNVLQNDPRVPHITCRPEQDKATPIPMNSEIEEMITKYNISFYPSKEAVVESKYFRLFLQEFRKFPVSLIDEMAASKAEIRLIIGNSVADDPEWNIECQRNVKLMQDYERFYKKDNSASQKIANSCLNTVDGRSWKESFVAGAGGNFSNPNFILPTRIVINNFYTNPARQPNGTIIQGNSGSANLFLHEHGHALDHAHGKALSDSPEWMAVMNDPQVKAYLPKISSSYEGTYPGEAFAEMFAYYYGCGAAKKQVEQEAPALANFLKNLKSLDYYPAARTPAGHSGHNH